MDRYRDNEFEDRKWFEVLNENDKVVYQCDDFRECHQWMVEHQHEHKGMGVAEKHFDI
jgi:hypothetical protein